MVKPPSLNVLATKHFDLVFHGGSGSGLEEIHETLHYQVIKMNIDTDTQYAFTRPIVDHIMTNYSGVLKIDGEVGVKNMIPVRISEKAARDGRSNCTGGERLKIRRP